MVSKIKYPIMISHKGKLLVGWWDAKTFKFEEFTKKDVKNAQALLDDLRQMEVRDAG